MKLMIAGILLLSSLSLTYAEETVSEQIQVKSNNVKREVRKGVNRMKEMACKEGDAKCLAKKAKHRVEESAEAVSDKTKEVVKKID
jgi:gas vesicle protein